MVQSRQRMTSQQAIDYWFNSAINNRQAAEDNYTMKHYDWCLFLWQLTLEKTLKGLIAKKGQAPPPIHNLKKLALIIFPTDNPYETELEEITTFNLEARYDDFKLSFYHKANNEFSLKWKTICEDIYQWLLKQS